MKQPHECTDLADLHAQFTTDEIVFNSNEMTMMTLEAGVSDEILDATTGILRVFAVRLGGESRFDFRSSTEDGAANMQTLDYIISLHAQSNDEMRVTLWTRLKNIILLKREVKKYPYSGWTQEQFDEYKSKHEASGITEASSKYYNGVDHNINGHFVNGNRARTIKYVVIFDSPVTHDCVVKISMQSETVEVDTWFDEDEITIHVKKGQKTALRELPNGFKVRRFRAARATVDLADTPFKLDLMSGA